ncbi:MAG: hypothetical protein KTR17_06020 [Cellvibrionaceae bacterium]|nr:hypothetical protein [Cellvibrionaceae bacterium]
MKHSIIVAIALALGVIIGFIVRDQQLSISDTPAALQRSAQQHHSREHQASTTTAPRKTAAKNSLGLGLANQDQALAAEITYADQISNALALKSNREKLLALERVFETLSSADAPFVLSDIQAIDAPFERRKAISVFFEKFGSIDGRAAYELAAELKGRERGIAAEAAMAGWAKEDVYAAWDLATDMMEDASSGIWRRFEAHKVFTEMAIQDPDNYLNYLNKQSGNQRQAHSMIRYYMDAAIETGQLQQYWKNLEQVPNQDNRDGIVEQFFREWGTLDPEQPLRAIEQIIGDREAETALRGFLNGWTVSDPESALDYAFQNLDTPSVNNSLKDMLSSAFYQGSADQNRQLVARIQSSDLTPETYRDTLQIISRTNPDLAMEMSNSVEDEQQRMELQQRAIQTLAHSDLDAATNYYEQANTAEQKARLFNSINWQLINRSDGGDRLSAMLEELPLGQPRTLAIQDAIFRASYRKERVNPNYRETLLKIASLETNLSEEAVKALDKLNQAP